MLFRSTETRMLACMFSLPRDTTQTVVLGYVQFLQDGLVGGVGTHGVGGPVQLLLDLRFINVDGQNVVTALKQLLR